VVLVVAVCYLDHPKNLLIDLIDCSLQVLSIDYFLPYTAHLYPKIEGRFLYFCVHL